MLFGLKLSTIIKSDYISTFYRFCGMSCNLCYTYGPNMCGCMFSNRLLSSLIFFFFSSPVCIGDFEEELGGAQD
jgi:hypothetical protein